VEILIIPRASIPEGGVCINVECAVKSLQPEGAEGLPMDAVGVAGALSPVGQEYIFQGHITGTYRHACDRCLDTAEEAVDIEVMWCFTEGLPSAETGEDADGKDTVSEEDREQWLIHGREIDLRPYVWEELVFALPAKFVCREDCRGLCPRCGANLNTAPCGCPRDTQEEGSNKGLAGLAELLPGLARMKPKE
jgi:uncharacterized protein